MICYYAATTILYYCNSFLTQRLLNMFSELYIKKIWGLMHMSLFLYRSVHCWKSLCTLPQVKFYNKFNKENENFTLVKWYSNQIAVWDDVKIHLYTQRKKKKEILLSHQKVYLYFRWEFTKYIRIQSFKTIQMNSTLYDKQNNGYIEM